MYIVGTWFNKFGEELLKGILKDVQYSPNQTSFCSVLEKPSKRPSRAECPFAEIAAPQPWEPLPVFEEYVEGGTEDELDDPWDTPA